jgi:transposase InsO family protein
MSEHEIRRRRDRWAQFRFSVVGPLLAAPPGRGDLHGAIQRLAETTWRHPASGEPLHLSFSTIERWYYAARAGSDPMGALGGRVRRDRGQQRRLGVELRAALEEQYRAHPSWSYKLHADNLAALAGQDPKLAPGFSYSTVLRHMKARGLFKQKRKPVRGRPGAERAARRFEQLETRSFEAEYVNGLWHADFHHGSRRLLTRAGCRQVPILLGFIDDRSRLACHLQWYLDETAESFVHGLSQAIQKRSLPRALMTDNGSAMCADEVEQGLLDLGIIHETTLPYSPHQNAKQENLWATVEGRLMAMLEAVEELTLEMLNEATQAWVELDYNRKVHSEIGCPPIARWIAGPDVSRPSPTSEALRRAFRAEASRRQRRTDGTISLAGRRFEIPSRYRHLERLHLRCARWDLRSVDLIDPQTKAILCALYPLDKSANADRRRRRVEPVPAEGTVTVGPAPGSGMAPLLRKLMEEYAATGLPPAYLPQPQTSDDEEPEP